MLHVGLVLLQLLLQATVLLDKSLTPRQLAHELVWRVTQVEIIELREDQVYLRL